MSWNVTRADPPPPAEPTAQPELGANLHTTSRRCLMDQSRKGATLDWTAEDEYWRSNYKNRPYAKDHDYSEWQPAYRYGYESARRYQNRKWEDAEDDLRSGWATYEHRGTS